MLTRSVSTIRRIAVASAVALTACDDTTTSPEPLVSPNNPTPPVPGTGLHISAWSTYMVTGSSQRLSASRVSNTGSARVAATWSSNNPSVITVDPTGMATAIGLGRAVVTATVDNDHASRVLEVITTSTSGTSNALIVDDFGVFEYQYPGSTHWEYAPQLLVHTETIRDIRILSITISIPGLDPIPSWGCLAYVPEEPNVLNGIAYGDWALSISSSERAKSTEVTATITFLDDLTIIASTTAKGRIYAGAVPTVYFDASSGGLCYRQYLP